MNYNCCICGRIIPKHSTDYLCDRCEDKYSVYEDDEPTVKPIKKRSGKRYKGDE